VIDRLWTGKPARRGTRHPGLLSLSLPLCRLDEYLAKAGAVNRHITPARIRGLAMFAEYLAGGWLVDISVDLREAVTH